MRIGIDARYAFRRSRRGIGEYVAALLDHLPAVASSEDRFLLYVDGPADLEAMAIPDPRFTLRALGASNPLVWEEIALPKAAAGDHLDLLHLTSNYGPSAPPCATVYTIHDLIEFIRFTFGPARLPFRHAAGRAVRIRTLPRQARRARRVITVSEASGRDLVRILHLPPEVIRVIPHGVPVPDGPRESAAEARDALRADGLAVPERYVFALGALDARKNGPFLMRSFARIHAEFPDVALWVAGVERPEEYPLPFAVQPSWLSIRGFVSRQSLMRLQRGAVAFVYPSLYEGFGFPVLEAMACRTAVLSSNSSSLPEVVGNAGILFDPRDEGALATALRQVLSDADLRATYIRAGLERVGQFSWPTTALKTYDVYREAVHGTA